MKNFLHAALFLLSLIIISSCSSEDPEPTIELLDTHEVGTWYLDGYIFSGVEQAYDSYNNTTYDISLNTLNDGSPLVYYEINFKGDSLFERKQKYYGYQVVRDTGMWLLDSTTQIMNISSDVFNQDEDFLVVLNEGNNLYMSQKITYPMIRDDSVAALEARYPVDSVLEAYFYDSLSDDERAAYFKNIVVDLVYAFSREQ